MGNLLQAHLILLRFAVLCLQILLSLQMEGLWQPCMEQVDGPRCSNNICSLPVSVRHVLLILTVVQTLSLLYLLW